LKVKIEKSNSGNRVIIYTISDIWYISNNSKTVNISNISNATSPVANTPK